MNRAPQLGDPFVAIDTALRRAVLAIGRMEPDGSATLAAADGWEAGHRHGEELLPHLDALLAANDLPRAGIRGIVVGTGPGAFTGLRVGIATAKALAHGLDVPIVGISTAAALLAAADSADGGTDETAPARALLLPAGPSDRVLVLDGVARLLPFGAEPESGLLAGLVAVDLADRAPEAALARGRAAVSGLAEALVRLGGGRLGSGDHDDLARLVPDYVTLPRGVTEQRGEVAWSRGPQ